MLLDVLEARRAAPSRWHVHSAVSCVECPLISFPGPSFAVNRTHRIVLGRVPPSGLSIGVLEHLRDVLLMALSAGAGDRAPAQCTKVPTIALPRSADRMELTQYYVCHSRVCIDTINMLIRAFSLPSLYALGYFSRLRQGDIFLSAVSERLF
jgi:hypothetical protein